MDDDVGFDSDQSGALPPEGQITGRATPVALRPEPLGEGDQGAAASPARLPVGKDGGR